MRVIGYTRVSTAEQAESGLGLAAQRELVVAECERRGWRLAQIHQDAGASGGSLRGRAALADALETLRRHEADALVVAKLDRLSRSILDFAAVMETARKQEWALVILDLGVDTTSPQGEMLANVMATFAQFERRLIGQRTKAALDIKRAQGVRLGRPRSTPAWITDRIRSLRLDGRTYAAIADDLNRASVPTSQEGRAWHASTVRKALLAADRATLVPHTVDWGTTPGDKALANSEPA